MLIIRSTFKSIARFSCGSGRCTWEKQFKSIDRNAVFVLFSLCNRKSVICQQQKTAKVNCMMFSDLTSGNFKQNAGKWRDAPLNEMCCWINKTL